MAWWLFAHYGVQRDARVPHEQAFIAPAIEEQSTQPQPEAERRSTPTRPQLSAAHRHTPATPARQRGSCDA